MGLEIVTLRYRAAKPPPFNLLGGGTHQGQAKSLWEVAAFNFDMDDQDYFTERN
jgi:hypothetical protein